MSRLVRIVKGQLPQLREFYKVDWPAHVISYAAIDHFIDRYNKHPEWEEKVKFWTLNDGWKQSGTFAMVNEHDNHILFETLEAWPYPTLQRTLELLDYEEEKAFICFRDIFRPLVLDVIRVQNLEVTFDSSTRCVHLLREKLNFPDEMTTAPKGFHFDRVQQEHVEKINSVWAQRSSTSFAFLSNIVAMNYCTGLFNSTTGELAAWTVTLETGSDGNLQVDEKYLRQGFGEIITCKHMKLRHQMGKESFGHIAHQNKKSFNLFTKLGGVWIDNNSWIGVRRKDPLKLIPLWGHL